MTGKKRTYEEVKLEPWWNQAPPFSVGNKLSEKHGLRAVSARELGNLKIDPKYLLDINVDMRDFSTLVMVLDTIILFSHAIMDMINKSEDVRPIIHTASYSELANKANELRERLASRTLKPSRRYTEYSEEAAERMWFENAERLKLLMNAMNQCHGILERRGWKKDKAMEYDEKRRRWSVASWIKPYRDLMNSMVSTIERLAMLMTRWSDLGTTVLDAIAEAMSDDAAD